MAVYQTICRRWN